MSRFLILMLAQGVGAGRIPIGPGTWGTLVGFGWLWVLLQLPTALWFVAATLVGVAVSIPLCSRAGNILKQKDPGSVVLDEIVALPICFIPWACLQPELPTLEDLFSPDHWPVTAAIFVAFRAFDIAKPWPAGQSQNLPGGWGVVADDVLAALYVAAICLAVEWIKESQAPLGFFI